MLSSRVALTGAFAAVLLTACGGDSEESVGANSPAPTKPGAAVATPTTDNIEAFVIAAEAICADLAATIPDEAPDLTTPEKVQAYAKQFTGNLATAQAAFAKLEFPTDSTGRTLRKILVSDFGERVKELQDANQLLDEAVAARDQARFKAALEQFGAVDETKLDKDGVMAESGLTTCNETIGPNA